MEFINLDSIVFRHLVKFEFDTSKAFDFKAPHHLFTIGESIHFKALMNNDYTDYNKLITTTNQKEHSEEDFKKLIYEFDIGYFKNNKMRGFYDSKFKKYVIKDGCHRLAILMFKDLVEGGNIPIEWFKIE